VKPPDFVVDNVPVILPAPEKDWPRWRHFKRKESTVNNFNSNYFKVKMFGRWSLRRLMGKITFWSFCFLGISVTKYSTVSILASRRFHERLLSIFESFSSCWFREK
jgi:hypothetical protein